MVLLGALLLVDAHFDLPVDLGAIPRAAAQTQTVLGLGLVGAAGLWMAVRRLWLRGRASVAIRAIRVVPRDPEPLARLLDGGRGKHPCFVFLFGCSDAREEGGPCM